jgi:hypothetical protein
MDGSMVEYPWYFYICKNLLQKKLKTKKILKLKVSLFITW